MNRYVLEKIKKLENGEVIISRESGNSMLPIIKSKEPVVLEPIDWHTLEEGDICFAKIHGTCYTHKVWGKSEEKGILLGNNKGHMNGWTKNVYGKAHLIPKEKQEDVNKYLETWKIDNGYGDRQN